MSETKHTPGPWKLRRLVDNSGQPYATLYQAHIDLEVCMIWAPPGNVEQEANAQLIARAPELLAENQRLTERVAEFEQLLKRFVALVGEHLEGAIDTFGDECWEADNYGPLIKDARKALGK